MSSPGNIFDPLEAFSEILGIEDLIEGRFENDGNGNPIYIGYSPIPNADPALPVWYIQFIVYDGQAIVRKRLPDDGIAFKYVWNDRADYFSA
jgi:hypothetical protein